MLISLDGADPAPAAGIPAMAQRCVSTPRPESQLVPAKFPRKKGVLHANMILFMIVIFRLMQRRTLRLAAITARELPSGRSWLIASSTKLMAWGETSRCG